MCGQGPDQEPGTLLSPGVLRAAAAGLLLAESDAAVRDVDAGLGSGPGASRAPRRPGPGPGVLLAVAARTSGGSVVPRPPGGSPGNVAGGRAGGQVGAGVGSGPPVSARAGGRAALLCPHVHLHGFGCEMLKTRGGTRQIDARGGWGWGGGVVEGGETASRDTDGQSKVCVAPIPAGFKS